MSIMVLNEIEVVPGDEDEEEDDHGDRVSEEAKEDDVECDGSIVEAEVAQVSSDSDHDVVIEVRAGKD